MTAPAPAGLETLGEGECWALLAATDVGRLGFVDAHGPAIEPFGHVPDPDRRLLLVEVGRTSGARAAVGQAVAFEVDGTDATTRTGWSVLVRGVLHVHLRPRPVEPAGWRAGGVVLRLDVEHLSGRALSRPAGPGGGSAPVGRRDRRGDGP